MKIIKTAILLAGISTAFAAQAAGVPSEMFQPRGAQVIKSKAQGNGEYELELRVRKGSVSALAQQAINHAQSKGYRLVEREIDRDDADLKFRKANRELDISIENKNNGWIEIDQDLDTTRN